MAINKKLIHFKKFSDFNSKKLSANEANTQYTVGISGDVQNGNPDILYESIVWIKDTKQQWTHGQLYDGSKSEETYLADFTMASLRQGMNNRYQVRCDMNSLIEAMTANKTILVREDEESDGYKGVHVLNGYVEDFLYFSIVDSQGDVLYCNGADYIHSDSIDGQTLHVRRWEDKGTYSKPSGGIPKSDLASDVQTSLGKADNSLQIEIIGAMEITTLNGIAGGSTGKLYALPEESTGDEDDILLSKKTVKTINGESIYGSGDITILGGSGTITEIKANGTSIATSGIANIPAATTSAYGVTKLTSSTNSTSTTLAATASAVKAAYDLANNYKGTVTSVKVNGVSKTPDSNGAVDVGYKFKQKIESSSPSLPLAPNIYYVMTSVLSSYTFTLTTLGNTDFMQEHFVEFTTRNSGSTVSFPSTIKWANGIAPIFEAGYTYQVSIVNNLGSYIKFK